MWKPPETTWSKTEFIGLACLLAALFYWTLAPLQGYDFWYYLAVGRYVAEGNGLPWSESFLGTTSSLAFGRYGDQTWLSSLYFYFLYTLGGTWGLVVSRSLLLSAITGVTYLNCRLLGASPWSAGLWVTLGLWTVRSRFLLRSYHFSDLGLAVLVFCLIRFHSHPSRRLIALAITFCLWSNFHQGVIAGWVLVFIWALFGGTSKLEGFKSLVVVFLASLVRPHGHLFLSFIYDHFANTKAVQGVVEWGPLSAVAVWEQLGAFLVIAVLLGVQQFRTSEKSYPWYYLVVVLCFLFLAIRSQRAVAELLPVAFPLLIPFLKQPQWKPWKVLLGIAALTSLMLYTNPPKPWSRITSVYPHYPVQLRQVASGLPSQVFNSYEYGSYLLFEGIPPFIHGTTSLFKEQLVADFQSVLNSSTHREAVIEQFGVQTFLLHLPKEEDATVNLVNYLYQHPQWKMVAWDDSGLVFTKGDATQGLVAVKPWETKVRWRDTAAAKAELEKLLETVPSALAHILLSKIANDAKDWPEVVRQARAALGLVPYSSRAWQALAFASYKMGDMETALEATREAARWAPDNPEVQFNRALILYRGHPDRSGFSGWLIEREIRYHLNETLRLSPGNQAAQTLLSELD
jgi:hypothetical protein